VNEGAHEVSLQCLLETNIQHAFESPALIRMEAEEIISTYLIHVAPSIGPAFHIRPRSELYQD
jgi:hypothetical protein